jgi:hypothetical protein
MSAYQGLALLPGRGRHMAHERSVQRLLGEKLAALLDCPFLGPYQAAEHTRLKCYFLPEDTLIGDDVPGGISGPEDFFGGQVGHAFMATKAISHPLPEGARQHPAGWSQRFGEQIASVTLPGFTVFDPEAARQAGQRLLRNGPLRLKAVNATAGRGQQVLYDAAELDAALEALDPLELSESGLVLEENLQQPTTYSVGQIHVADTTLSYYGTQQLTRDNAGEPVYGGSSLTLVRGDYLALMTLDLPRAVRLAVQQARIFELTALEAYPSIRASRRNYDVAQGVNDAGQPRSGVLEQSWRIGGASPAEIFALAAFLERPELQQVQASTHEYYGEALPPVGAICLYQGEESELGPMSKYVRVVPA